MMNRKPSSKTVTLEQGERALIVTARLVNLYGEICLPLFERMERDLINLYRREAAKERARSIAKTEDIAAYIKAADSDPFTILETFDWEQGARPGK